MNVKSIYEVKKYSEIYNLNSIKRNVYMYTYIHIYDPNSIKGYISTYMYI